MSRAGCAARPAAALLLPTALPACAACSRARAAAPRKTGVKAAWLAGDQAGRALQSRPGSPGHNIAPAHGGRSLACLRGWGWAIKRHQEEPGQGFNSCKR